MSFQRIGFLGLGTMGTPMARNLAKKGFQVVVWNRGRSKSEALRGDGIQVAASPQALAGGVDAFCTCLSDPAAVSEVVFATHGLLAGARPKQAFVDFSTGSVEMAKSLYEACTARGIDFVDAPITGSRLGAESGALVIMAGGRDEALERVMPILQAVGVKVVHCGPAGTGTQVKLAGNAVIASMLQAFSESMLLVAKAGIAPQKFLEVVMASGYQSPYFEFKAKALIDHDFSPHFTIDLMHKDLTLMVQSAAALKVPTPTAAAVVQTYNLARAAGKGHLDISAVITVFEELIGQTIADAAS